MPEWQVTLSHWQLIFFALTSSHVLHLASGILYLVDMMARDLIIICVTGAHSSVGKTTLCSILLNNLTGFGAIKFTRTSLYTSVTDDVHILNEKGKDTSIYLGAGAERAVWVQSPGGEQLSDALDISLSKMSGLNGVIVEGNSPAELLKPCISIFIVGSDGQIKPSAFTAADQAEIIVVNTDKVSGDSTIPGLILKKQTEIFRIDLEKKTGEIDKFLNYIKQYVVSNE